MKSTMSSGETYGNIVVIEKTTEKKYGRFLWRCYCMKCDSIKKLTPLEIRNKNRQSCGCRQNRDKSDEIGKKYGDLIVLEEIIKNNENDNHRYFKCECLLCGKIKSCVGDVIKAGHIKSCGNHRPSGENHHWYNPDADRQRRDSTEHKNWSKAVLKNADYKCCICNKNYKLRAHHLDGWGWAVDKRFDITNGSCCCDLCHQEFHRRYGRGYNTKEQFEQFKELRRGL